MDPLEVRELRYFLTVAEELHFGRAAGRLSIAQPALSKTIQRTEARLGVQLFTRTSRNVTLTRAGEALLEHGRVALTAMTAAVQSAQRAGRDDHLRLVLKPGGDANLLSGILAAYATTPGAHQVDILFSGSTDRVDHLLDGRADVALLYAPFDDLTGLAHEELRTEDRVAVLPATHRLADRAAVHLADLKDETFPRWRGVGGAVGQGPEVADVAELIPLVAIGRVIAVLPRSLVSPVPPGLVMVTVEDAEPSHLLVAHLAHDNRDSVRAFVHAARASVAGVIAN